MNTAKKPTLFMAILPVIILIAIMAVGVYLFGDELTNGPSQMALVTAAIVGALVAMFKLNIPWEKIEAGILKNLSNTGGAIFILLMIGALTASWIQSGVVPTLIYYGLKVIHPSVFLLIVFIFTGVISLMAGSSWTTIGTIGVAMISTGEILGFHSGWLAGAIISGAYLGDKLSPLSDTTNLAASISEVDLYKHIKYMTITNIPTFILVGVIFAVAGFFIPVNSTLDVEQQCAEIASTYNISLWLLLIPCFTIFLIFKKLSPFITLFLSAVVAVVVAMFAQPDIINQISPYSEGELMRYIYVPLKMLSSHVDIETGNDILNGLASTNGMGGMMNTIWLILCVVCFGGVMESAGYINAVTEKIAGAMKSATSLVASTIGTCVFCNIVISDQYMSILIPGKMFTQVYKDNGYEARLLSRSLEDSATVTSVLVPWNTCGVVQSSVLGVPTLTYLPYCFFNYLSPVISIFVAAAGYKIYRFGKSIKREKKNCLNQK
ncbi:MAG: sodium:proton antiporter [Bacteroidales bacterium]|nr:sodium:proton antiporter [Bacteroidales bacterium]